MSTNSWVIHKQKYQRIASEIEPAARLSTKDALLWKAVAAILMVVSFGRLGYRRFLDDYATTFGPIQAYPVGLDGLSTRLLVHECRHTTQAVWLGWSFPVLGWFFGRRVRAYAGLPLMAVLYLLFPLIPVGMCLCRWLFELDADRASWRWMLRNGYTAGMVTVRAEEFARKVCGGAYVFAWPNNLGGVSVFKNAAAKVIAEHGKAKAGS